MYIGERLRMLRAERSQSEVARAVGVTREAVSQWESGMTKGLKPENLLAVADYFGVEIRWLVTGVGQKRKEASSRGPPLAEAASGDTRKSGPALSQPPLTAKRGALPPPLAKPDLDPNVLALARAIESLPADARGHLQAVTDSFVKSQALEDWNGVERRKGGQKR